MLAYFEAHTYLAPSDRITIIIGNAVTVAQ
jgi:hypothetical protein